jgi:hypothetical protein
LALPVHVNEGVSPTAVAPFAGDGAEGAAGNEAVTKDQIAPGVDPATFLATIFQ